LGGIWFVKLIQVLHDKCTPIRVILYLGCKNTIMALGDSLKNCIDLAKNKISQAGDVLKDSKDQVVVSLKRNAEEARESRLASRLI
jgi:hypothetical protein